MKINLYNFIFFLLMAGNNSSIAQSNYIYDANGNRTHREMYVGPPSNNRNFNPGLVHPTNAPTAGDKALFHAMKFGISVFPSIVSDILNITISNANAQNLAQVFVFDNNGKALINTEINNPSPNQLNFGSIKNGIYNIKVLMGGEQVFYKVVKAN